MSIATLSDIITKVRKLTGSGNSLQITDSAIIDYINSFYLYDFPAEFRSLQLKQTFTFNTIQNIDTYPFDFEHYSSVEMPAYVNKRLVPLYTSPWPFYSLFFNWQNREVLDTGDGTVGPYSGTVLDFPIIRSYNNNPKVDSLTLPTATFATNSGYPPSFTEPNPARAQNILISVASGTTTLHATDDGNGNLIGDVTSGTINYATGAVSNLNFNANADSNASIYIAYNPVNAAIPQAILFWQNQLTLRPVPDAGYIVEITAYRKPSQILLGSVDPAAPDTTGVPELFEWWETLAAGAAKKIFEDRQDMEGIQIMDKMLMERYALNETRTYAQLGKQSMGSIFRDQLSGYSGGFTPFGGNNG